MRSDNLEKLFKEKIEEAQSAPEYSQLWNKEAAWQHIQDITPAAVTKNKKPAWYFYAAAILILTLLAGWPLQKLLLDKPAATKVAFTKAAVNPAEKVDSDKKDYIIKGQLPVAITNKAIKKTLVIINKTKPKGLASKKIIGNENFKKHPLLLAGKATPVDSSGKGLPIPQPITQPVNPIAPPVKVKIVLGASTTNKLEALAAAENNHDKKTKKTLRLKHSEPDNKSNSKNLTAIKRDRNPLSLNPKIEL